MQSSVIALGLAFAAVACFGRDTDALHWLGVGLSARAVLGTLAGVGYGVSTLEAARR